MDIFNPSSFTTTVNANILDRYRDEVDGTTRGSGLTVPHDVGYDGSAAVKIHFDRSFGGAKLRDYLMLDAESLLKLSNAIEAAKLANAGNFVANGPSGDHFMRGNNVVLKDWPEDSLLKNSRYRAIDAYGMNWSGPLRTLGVLTNVHRPRLVGYVVTRNPLVALPNLEKKIIYPLGSASVRLDKTHQDLKSIHKMMPVYASFETILDVSVSSMVEEEGRFLRNTISPHQFSYDVLEVHKRANELRGDFLASAIEGHNDIYLWGVTEYCIKNAQYGIYDLDTAANLLCSLVGSYNYASMGVKYQYLSSKALPDPIKVGNMGDVNGNMASPEPEFDLASKVGDLYNGALGFLQTMYASPTLGQIGLAQNDGEGSTGPRWSELPAPDGGMAWNISHMQAAYHLDGELIAPPANDWFNGVRLIVVNNDVSNRLASAGIKGSGSLELIHKFSEDYVFIPAVNYSAGHSDVIHQNGSVINLLIDRYNPEVDDDS